MAQWLYPEVAHVLRIHATVLQAHGGSEGLRVPALLESAVAAPRATYGGEALFKDPVEIAAAYLFYICRNQAFVDGNKRTALATCLMFLRLNGVQTTPDGPEWEALVLDVAASRLDRDQTTAGLKRLLHL